MAETTGERLAAVWARTDRIFEILAPEAIFAQPIALRHPFIFYVGHLPAFAWNHICDGVLGRPSLNPAYDELFSRGIDPDVDDPAWFDDSLSEIGDICAWKSPDVRVDGYFVQRMWSQRRGACMAVPGPVDGSQRVMQSCENAAMKVAACVDVQSNGWNCGGCGNRCAANETCSAGHCQVTPGCHDAICGPAGVALISGAITQTILFPLPLSDSGPSGILLPTGGVRIDLFDWYPLRAQYTELDSTGYIRCYERESSNPTDVRNDIWDVVPGQYGSFTLTITNGYPLRGSLHAECFPATKGAQGIVHLDMTF